MSDLPRTISNIFPNKKIVILGDLVADQFLSGSITRVSREAPVFVLRHDETETRPGAAANAAANVASLGGRPVAVGVVGNDDNGNLLLDRLNQSRVDCDLIVRSSDVSTTTKVRVLAGQNYSVKQQVMRIDYEGTTGYPDALETELHSNLERASANAGAIVASDYGYGVVTSRLFAKALEIGRQRGIPVIVDSRYRLREFAGATSATPNHEEVEGLLGRKLTDIDCQNLCNELDLDSLLVTLGNKGMIVCERGKPVVRMPVVGSTEPVDVTGAGDTVIAAYSLGLAAGLSPLDATVIANHAGGIVVMKKGTATASTAELLDSLSEHETFASDTAV